MLIFCALLIGMFTKLCTIKFKLPYTPVLTVLGIIIALIDLSVYRKDHN